MITNSSFVFVHTRRRSLFHFGILVLLPLCVSAVFTVAHLSSVLLSVCLSVRHVSAFYPDGRRPTISSSSFLGPVDPSFYFLDSKRQNVILNEPYLRGGVKYKGMGKFCDFRLKSPFILETVRDRPMVAVKR